MPWQAEYLIGAARHQVLALGCLRLGLTTRYAKGDDLLPCELTAPLEASLVRSHGARILQPPADYPFRERQYTAEDPCGHRWTFSQSIADVRPEEWGGVSGQTQTA